MDIHAHIPNNLDAKNMHFDGLIIEKTSSLGKYNHDIPHLSSKEMKLKIIIIIKS